MPSRLVRRRLRQSGIRNTAIHGNGSFAKSRKSRARAARSIFPWRPHRRLTRLAPLPASGRISLSVTSSFWGRSMAENITAAAVLAAVLVAPIWLMLKSWNERCKACNSMLFGWSSKKVADLDARLAYFECKRCGNRIQEGRLDEQGHVVWSDGGSGAFLENGTYVPDQSVGGGPGGFDGGV